MIQDLTPLAAFRVRSFRLQWPADLLTSLAFQMETVILGWYVLVQTGSVLLLTAFGSLMFLGTLLAPMFGVLGDRLGSRVMLVAMRTIYEARSTGKTLTTAAEDRARFDRYAAAYAAAGGPQQADVERWKKTVDR